MNRRAFLKLGSLALLASFARLPAAAALPASDALPAANALPAVDKALAAAPQAVAFQGRHYRGAGDGKIYVSATGGQTWQLHTDLGRPCTITGLYTTPAGRLVSRVQLQGHPFELELTPDGRFWQSPA